MHEIDIHYPKLSLAQKDSNVMCVSHKNREWKIACAFLFMAAFSILSIRFSGSNLSSDKSITQISFQSVTIAD